MFYRKNPVAIEARQWEGGATNATPIIDWVLSHGGTARYHEEDDAHFEHLQIETLEGVMRTSPGDYVIRGVQDEFYPCKPDIFADTYTLATDPVRVPLGVDVIVTENDEDAVRLIVARHVVQRRVPRAEGEGYELTPRSAQLVSLHAQQWVHAEDGEAV